MQSAVRTHSDSGFSESELRLRQTSLLQTHLLRLHSLSAAGDLSLSAGFSAGASSESPSAGAGGQMDDSESHRKLLALNHHVNR